MLAAPSGKLWVYHGSVDLRKSYHSLSVLVEQELSRQAKSGDGFIFVNRRKTLAKVVWWDRTGWCLLLKRLSTGRYRVSGKPDVRELEKACAQMFFDGL